MLDNPYLRRDVWIFRHIVERPGTDPELTEERQEMVCFAGNGENMKAEFDKVLQKWNEANNFSFATVSSFLAGLPWMLLGAPWFKDSFGLVDGPLVIFTGTVLIAIMLLAAYLGSFIDVVYRQITALECSIDVAPFTRDDDFVHALEKADPTAYDHLEELRVYDARFSFLFIEKVGSDSLHGFNIRWELGTHVVSELLFLHNY